MSRSLAHSDVFQAIADPTRRGILSLLCLGEQPAGTLARQFQMTPSAISQHLSVLKETGLVEVRQVGRERRYRINAEPLQAVSAWVSQYEPFWREKLDSLGRYLEEEAGMEKAGMEKAGMETAGMEESGMEESVETE